MVKLCRAALLCQDALGSGVRGLRVAGPGSRLSGEPVLGCEPSRWRQGRCPVADLGGTAVRTLRRPREPSTTGQLAWSPDGTKLAYATHMHGAPLSGGVFVQDVAGGRKTEVNFLDAFGLDIVNTAAVFSADGQRVLFRRPAATTERHPTCGEWRPWKGASPPGPCRTPPSRCPS